MSSLLLTLAAWWKRDVALNTYIFGLTLIGIPFTAFATYVVYQLQVVGYLIGASSDGLPCVTYCLVPFGSRMLDLNSVLLYLNALGFGLGGALAMLISAYADFWSEFTSPFLNTEGGNGRGLIHHPNKKVLVSLLTVLYGVVCVPVYWLRDPTVTAFNALMALYVVYAITTYVIVVVFNMFIPHCMRTSASSGAVTSGPVPKAPIADANSLESQANVGDMTPAQSRGYGFKMSIWGSVGTFAGGIIALVVAIILSQTRPAVAAQSSGLLLTTASGFVTVVGAVVIYHGLPALAPKPGKRQWNAWWVEILTPLKDLFRRKNMALLLLSYTIYTDTVFAVSSVTSQLFFTEMKPDALEISLYSLANSFLESWLIIGYAMILIVPVWGCIGLSEAVDFGFKYRWEFYVQNFVFYLSGAIVNSTFRVLYSELVPKGSEIEWFGLQVVISCATAWVSYIANAPLQGATNQLRFPLVLCTAFLSVPLVLEIYRKRARYFINDRLRWQNEDQLATESPSKGSSHP
ncbi:autophagy-related protein 22 [Apiospora saccharicola]|uniref:Autophagy-related protein n=1 Tax=Apiospora saccharicola TaxID=335842 RepID=A0ABR1UZ95_9PEZI